METSLTLNPAHKKLLKFNFYFSKIISFLSIFVPFFKVYTFGNERHNIISLFPLLLNVNSFGVVLFPIIFLSISALLPLVLSILFIKNFLSNDKNIFYLSAPKANALDIIAGVNFFLAIFSCFIANIDPSANMTSPGFFLITIIYMCLMFVNIIPEIIYYIVSKKYIKTKKSSFKNFFHPLILTIFSILIVLNAKLFATINIYSINSNLPIETYKLNLFGENGSESLFLMNNFNITPNYSFFDELFQNKLPTFLTIYQLFFISIIFYHFIQIPNRVSKFFDNDKELKEIFLEKTDYKSLYARKKENPILSGIILLICGAILLIIPSVAKYTLTEVLSITLSSKLWLPCIFMGLYEIALPYINKVFE